MSSGVLYYYSNKYLPTYAMHVHNTIYYFICNNDSSYFFLVHHKYIWICTIIVIIIKIVEFEATDFWFINLNYV